MSRRSTNPAKQVPAAERKPEDVLAVESRDAWVGTRFALPPYYTSHMRYALKSQLMFKRSMRFFRMDGLSEEKRAELFALLDGQGCEYEVWR